jgi:hypothetical protein
MQKSKLWRFISENKPYDIPKGEIVCRTACRHGYFAPDRKIQGGLSHFKKTTSKFYNTKAPRPLSSLLDALNGIISCFDTH